MSDVRVNQAIELMSRFEQRGRRYLWTDAFAVTNYLALAERTGDQQYLKRAVDLIHRVHRELGRHAAGSVLTGWISGLDEAEGAAHPTAGGLRIGKPLAERAPDEPFDTQLEWERDGQYFHYLTKWMHALDQTSRATGDPTFNCQARELAASAHRAFVRSDPTGGGGSGGSGGSAKRMYWKMSIDLTRPLVPSMGQHDPLDGFVTYVQLQTIQNPSCPVPRLDRAVIDFARMLDRERLATEDPLGIGGLLTDAYRLFQLHIGPDNLIDSILHAASVGLAQLVRKPELRASADLRLAFRELGLAIGLEAVELMPAGELEFREYLAVGDAIRAFWLDPRNQRADTWQAHLDINEVMLATTLIPDGFVSILNQVSASPSVHSR